MAVSHFWKDFVGAGVFSYFMMAFPFHQGHAIITLKIESVDVNETTLYGSEPNSYPGTHAGAKTHADFK